MDSLGKAFAILISVSLFFIYPAYYMSLKQDNMNRMFITNEVIYFVDSVRNLGYFSGNMYDTFKKRLNTTGGIYEIEMVHYQKVLYEADGIYKGRYLGIYTEDILEKLYENSSYELKKGDFYSVKIYNKSKTIGNKVTELLLSIPITEKYAISAYGGAVRDEAY